MVTINFQDTYFFLMVHPSYFQYLRFEVGDTHLQPQVLLFEISIAPRVFTKMMVIVMAHLRLSGLMVFPYIDNWLLVEESDSNSKVEESDSNSKDIDMFLELLLGVYLTVSYVPGIANVQADSLSCKAAILHKWELNWKYLGPLFLMWGSPDEDVFATWMNRKLHHFCTRGKLIQS